MLLSRPQLGSYECMKASNVPLSYWLSPRLNTLASPVPSMRSEVYCWRQLPGEPSPPLNEPFAGSQAMSPAAAITGLEVAAATRPLSAEIAALKPAVLEAVTATRIVEPTSFRLSL